MQFRFYICPDTLSPVSLTILLEAGRRGAPHSFRGKVAEHSLERRACSPEEVRGRRKNETDLNSPACSGPHYTFVYIFFFFWDKESGFLF